MKVKIVEWGWGNATDRSNAEEELNEFLSDNNISVKEIRHLSHTAGTSVSVWYTDEEESSREVLMNQPIEKLGLNYRTRRVLHNIARINTTRELCKMSESDLLACRTLGNKSLQHIIDRLDKAGLSLEHM